MHSDFWKPFGLLFLLFVLKFCAAAFRLKKKAKDQRAFILQATSRLIPLVERVPSLTPVPRLRRFDLQPATENIINPPMNGAVIIRLTACRFTASIRPQPV